MIKTGIMKKIDSIISPIYVALLVGTSVFFAVWLARITKQVSRGESNLDISNLPIGEGHESYRDSATRLNAIWLRERSQA